MAAGNIEQCHELIKSIPGVTYLQHSSTKISVPGHDIPLRIFGSPYSPEQLNQNWAFQYPPAKADEMWDAVPRNTDVLITHTPPSGYCDRSEHWREGGCLSLTQALGRIKPALHICGHCHEGRGGQVVRWSEDSGMAESVWTWKDASVGTKKQSLLDLTGLRGGNKLEVGRETAVINSSIMAKSWGIGAKAFNKPIVVDINYPLRQGD